jgi:hypothetical protein
MNNCSLFNNTINGNAGLFKQSGTGNININNCFIDILTGIYTIINTLSSYFTNINVLFNTEKCSNEFANYGHSQSNNIKSNQIKSISYYNCNYNFKCNTYFFFGILIIVSLILFKAVLFLIDFL